MKRTKSMRRWFDAHLDLAYLALNGRDMNRGLSDCGGPHLPAAVTLPALEQGHVKACLGTIFTERDGTDAVGYPADDAEAAHAAGMRQLEQYNRWQKDGWFGPFSVNAGRIHLGILMECADPIRRPDELSWWT